MKRLAIVIISAGCAHARTPDAYRADTATVLAAQEADFKACYDDVLKTMPTAAGHVVVNFAVEPKTGRLVDAQIDTTQTTAPDAVNQCVLHKLPELSLASGDRNRGKATWSWDFVAQPAAPGSDAKPAAAPVTAAPHDSAAPSAAPAPAPAPATAPPATAPAPMATHS